MICIEFEVNQVRPGPEARSIHGGGTRSGESFSDPTSHIDQNGAGESLTASRLMRETKPFENVCKIG